MQAYMQLSKGNKMQSERAENEEHSGMQVRRSERILRAYKAKPKENHIFKPGPDDQRKIGDDKEVRETLCPRAATPSNIDLPFSVYQGFTCNNIASLLPSSQSSAGCSPKKNIESNSDISLQNYYMQNFMQSQLPVNTQGETQEVADNINTSREQKRALISYKKGKKSESLIKARKIPQNSNEEVEGKIDCPMKRPEHKVLGFMEDHAEFVSDWEVASKSRGHHVSSVLESTVDGSIIKGARRVIGPRRMTSEELTYRIESAIEIGDIDEDPLIVLDEWGLKSESHKYKCSLCEKISPHRLDIEQHIHELKGTCHSDAVVEVLLGNQAQGRSCTLCNVRLQRTEYFTHIREKHKEVFPLRCGYCAFQGQDYNQLRHHIQKKHKTSKFSIIDITQSKDADNNLEQKKSVSKQEILSDEEEEENETVSSTITCPLCFKSFKGLRNLKKHIMQHSRKKRQCMLCDFITNFPTQIRSHYRRIHPNEKPAWKEIVVAKGGSDALVDDASPFLKMVSAKYGVRKPKEKNWARQYRCPHCSYTCNFNSSYNRHLRVHEGIKRYKCGYCSFHGREPYAVKKHCRKTHKEKDVLVEKGKHVKAPYRYAKGIKKESADWEGQSDVNKEVDVLVSKSSDVSSLHIKVEVQSEELNKSNLSETSSNFDVRQKETNKENLKKNCRTDRKKDDMHKAKKPSKHKTKKPSMHKAKKSTDLEGMTKNAVQNESDLLSLPSQYSNDDAKSNLENLFVNDCQVPLTESGKLMPISVNCISLTHIKDIVSKVEEPLPEVVHAKCVPKGKDVSEGYSSMQQKLMHTIKVKTFRDKTEKPKESVLNREHSFEERNSSRMQIHSDSDRVSSIIDFISSDISDPSGSNFPSSSLETVVINLYANDSYTPRELITHNSTEQLEDGCVYNEKIFTISDHEDNPLYLPLNLTVSDLEVEELSDKRKNICASQASSNQSFIPLLKCSETNGKININSHDGSTFTIEKSSDLPPEGLESTLHNHISFLSDSLAHRVSNCISAPPGVMTRDLLGLDYSNSDYFSSEKVRMMMIKKKGGLAMCTECGVTTTYRAFYKHAKKHFNIKPFKCGYCSYRSIEKSKIRVHNAFCHQGKPCVILKLSPDSARVGDTVHQSFSSKTSEVAASKLSLENEDGLSENSEIYSSMLKNTRTSVVDSVTKDMKKENKKNPTSSARMLKKMTLFRCPLCCKVIKNHSTSIRRHLYSHYGYKPYRCGYCTFTAIKQTEIRAHHITHGSVNPPKIEQSDASMPHALTQYIKDILGQQRRSKRVNKKKEMDIVHHLDMDKNPNDIMWHEPEASREDLSAISLHNEDPSQADLVTDDHQDLESLGVEAYSFQQTLESVEFNATESPFTVQVLDSGGQSSDNFSTDLPSHLDLNVGTESDSNSKADPVCVVYLIS